MTLHTRAHTIKMLMDNVNAERDALEQQLMPAMTVLQLCTIHNIPVSEYASSVNELTKWAKEQQNYGFDDFDDTELVAILEDLYVDIKTYSEEIVFMFSDAYKQIVD